MAEMLVEKRVGSKTRKVGCYAWIVGCNPNEAGCVGRIVGSNAPLPKNGSAHAHDLTDLHHSGTQINWKMVKILLEKEAFSELKRVWIAETALQHPLTPPRPAP
ncbi:hypothetical protein [Metabacillus indicus]|uniref:hypothetical protein n=1 Tax=Metabacillus indicus TaxID=246786 RepID=UPI003CF6DD1C